MEEDKSIIDQSINCFEHLSIPRRWILAEEICNGHSLNQRTLYQADTFDTLDPDWEKLFLNKNQRTVLTILQDILEKSGEFVKQLSYNCHDIFCSYVGTNAFDLIVRQCKNLERISIHEGVRTLDLFQLANHCHNVVEFRMAMIPRDCDVELRVFFQNNINLKFITLDAKDLTGRCFLYLRKTAIEELILLGLSVQAMSYLVLVLDKLDTLKTLQVNEVKINQSSSFMEAIDQCRALQKLTLSVQTIYHALITSGVIIQYMNELNLTNQDSVCDEMLGVVAYGLRQLRSIDLSGCLKVTDDGVIKISTLLGIKQLNLSELSIKGKCLKSFNTLEHLECRRSTVFDLGLCHVIRNCKNLQFLDTTTCFNVSSITIDCAIETLKLRDNNLKLRMISDPRLILRIKTRVPELLELICSSYLPGSHFMERRFYSPRSVDSYHGSIEYKFQQQHNFWLNDDCVIHVLSFVPIMRRISMERVCDIWKEWITSSWRKIKKLDLSTPDWAYLFFDKNPNEIDSILEKVLNRVGMNLTQIELREPCSVDEITKKCAKLENIYIYFRDIRTGVVVSGLQRYKNLKKLSIDPYFINNLQLTHIFQQNQQLEYLKLYEPSLQIQQLEALNPMVLKELHLFESTSLPVAEFERAFNCFVNLEKLSMIDCLITNAVIRAINNMKNLKLLALKISCTAIRLNLNALTNLFKLEQLCICYPDIDGTFFQRLTCHCPMLCYIDLIGIFNMKQRLTIMCNKGFMETKFVFRNGCDLVTDPLLLIITMLPNLHTLIINHIYRLNGTGLLGLSGVKFRRLECQGCNYIQQSPLCNVLNKCPKLELLNITGCKMLDETTIDTAFEITKRRQNGIILKLFAHEELIKGRRYNCPELLKLFIVRECWYQSDE